MLSHDQRWPSLRLAVFLLGICAAAGTSAAPTTLSVSHATAYTTTTPVTLNFPVSRSGDLGYDVVLTYHTIDGTAVSPIDYTGTANGAVVIPAGSATGSIPVGIAAYAGSPANRSFTLALDGAFGVGPAASFGAKADFGTGTNPTGVLLEDVNGDGKPDLISVNQTANTISVLLNATASGTSPAIFGAKTDFGTGAGTAPGAIAIGDVNGDGMPDIAVAAYSSDGVSVAVNTTAPGVSTPAFGFTTLSATAPSPQAIALADMNGDGRLDVITGNGFSSATTLSVLLNATNLTTGTPPTPTFAAHQDFSTGYQADAVTVADVDGDGRPDVIVANALPFVTVLRNTTPSGSAVVTFAPPLQLAAGSSPMGVAAADINGDGRRDILVANNASNTVSVFINTTTAPGAPAFAAQQTFAVGANPTGLQAVDINGDGKPDLVVSNYGSSSGNTISVLRNITRPGSQIVGLEAHQTFTTGTAPWAVAAGDINGDGRADIAAANLFGNSVSVLLNTIAQDASLPGLAAPQNFAANANANSITRADFDGDGRPDLLAANFVASTPAGANVSALRGTTAPGAATATFDPSALFSMYAGGTYYPWPYSALGIDINGDGRPDLVSASYGSRSIGIRLNAIAAPGPFTSGSFGGVSEFDTGTASPTSLGSADFNGDGRPDLFYNLAYAGATGLAGVMLNAAAPGGAPGFRPQNTFAIGTDGTHSVASADLNGDGKPDLIAANYLDSSLHAFLGTTAPGATAATFAAPSTFATGSHPSSAATGDLNGDGRADVVTVNFSDGNASIFINTAVPGPAGSTAPAFATRVDVGSGIGSGLRLVDVNGDGRLDIVATHSTANTLSVFLNTTAPGSTTPGFALLSSYGTDAGPKDVASLDINGDGKADLVTANYTAGTVSVFMNTQYQATATGSATGTIISDDAIFRDGFEP